MIKKVLTVLREQLNDDEEGINDDLITGDIAVVDDVAKHDDDGSGLDNKVIITLLNVEEESTLKNSTRYIKVPIGVNPTPFDLKMESPPAYINLYVIISANRVTYENALANISKVIEIFQKKNVLEYVHPTDVTKNFKFRIELHSVPFDQLSYIWGLLGGKVMPSVLYKISVIKIVADDIPKDIELINEINIDSIEVNP